MKQMKQMEELIPTYIFGLPHLKVGEILQVYPKLLIVGRIPLIQCWSGLSHTHHHSHVSRFLELLYHL